MPVGMHHHVQQLVLRAQNTDPGACHPCFPGAVPHPFHVTHAYTQSKQIKLKLQACFGRRHELHMRLNIVTG